MTYYQYKLILAQAKTNEEKARLDLKAQANTIIRDAVSEFLEQFEGLRIYLPDWSYKSLYLERRPGGSSSLYIDDVVKKQLVIVSFHIQDELVFIGTGTNVSVSRGDGLGLWDTFIWIHELMAKLAKNES